MIRMAYVICVNDGNGEKVDMTVAEFNTYESAMAAAGGYLGPRGLYEFNTHESAMAFAREIKTNNPELVPVVTKVMRRVK